MTIWQELVGALPFLRNAFFVGILIGSLAPLIGAYFVLRRIVLLGVTIPQVSSAGIAAAMLAQGLGWFGLNPVHTHGGQGVAMIGSLFFTLIVIVFLGMLAHRKAAFTEVAVGFTFAAASALSILLLSQSPVAESNMLNLLKGEIIATTETDLIRTLLFWVLVVGALVTFHKEFLLIAYDRDFAVSVRKPVARYDLLFFIVAGFAVSLCVLTVGPITTFGYLVLPPMIALLFTRGMARFFLVSSLTGAVGAVVSLVVAFLLDLPVGPTTVVVLALAYVVCWAGRRAALAATAGRSGAV
jgi:ABC-type Mn2+/Zn2+ transport system permease subunit